MAYRTTESHLMEFIKELLQSSGNRSTSAPTTDRELLHCVFCPRKNSENFRCDSLCHSTNDERQLIQHQAYLFLLRNSHVFLQSVPKILTETGNCVTMSPCSIPVDWINLSLLPNTDMCVHFPWMRSCGGRSIYTRHCVHNSCRDTTVGTTLADPPFETEKGRSAKLQVWAAVESGNVGLPTIYPERVVWKWYIKTTSIHTTWAARNTRNLQFQSQ